MEPKTPAIFEFQIIAGDLKGRVIRAPNFGETRPPLTRLRKAIFDFLWPYLREKTYLDLFSGTGSYLFEAVSRGAVKATGVELDQRLVTSITTQAKDLNVAASLTCLAGDVFDMVSKLHSKGERFDVIMIAPPQYKGMIDRTLKLMRDASLSNKGGIIVCQHDTSELKSLRFTGYTIEQQRKYGNTTFTVLSGNA